WRHSWAYRTLSLRRSLRRHGSLSGRQESLAGVGFFVRAVSRRNIFAIVVGALLAGTPLVAFNFWLDGLIDRQGEAEVGTSAKRAIALAETRVRDTVGALDSL